MPEKFSRIAVVGGTRFDSQKGMRFLRSKGIESTPVNMSENPDEQSKLYFNPDLVYKRFMEKAADLGFSDIVFYCTSLSFSCEWETRYDGRLYELSPYYKSILSSVDLEGLLVVVAEEKTKQNLLNFVARENICNPEHLNVEARLDLINQLESTPQDEQYEIVKTELAKYQAKGFKELVLGCTHLDDAKFDQVKGVKIYQPGLRLLNDFADQFYLKRSNK